jgi:hypothetical protein
MGKPLTVSPVPDKLTAAQRRQLRGLVQDHGLASVARAAKLDLETVARALAEIPMRTSSVAALIFFLEAQ